MELSRFISAPTKTPDKMGFDEVGWLPWGRWGPRTPVPGPQRGGVRVPQVFMINLQRRKDRRERMLRALWEQEIKCRLVDAVDGK